MSLDRIGGRYSGDSEEPEEKKHRFFEPGEKAEGASKKVAIDLGTARAVPVEPEPDAAPAVEAETEEPKRRRSFRKKAEEVDDEDRIGTWADTGYSASDEEAHRDVRYDSNSPVKRVLNVFMTQMKLFSSNKWTYILVFAAVLIPVIVTFWGDYLSYYTAQCGLSTQYMGFLLCLMPLMVSFFTAVLCGTQIPNEFKDRTAYMSMPLPVTRLEFYLGKYLAGFVLCLGIFLMAFGFATVLAMQRYDSFFTGMVSEALVLTIVTIFTYSATAFCIGCFMKRGSTLVPLMLNFLIFPAVFMGLGLKYEIEELFLMPCFLPDAILGTLGAPFIMSIQGMFITSGIAFTDLSQIWTIAGIGILWGAGFLALGAYKMIRREM